MGGDAGMEVGGELLVCSAELADVTAAELVGIMFDEAAAVAVEFMDHETVEL
jgi:hypothetical protein